MTNPVTSAPLLILTEARIQRELQRARLAAEQMRVFKLQILRVLALCVFEILLGYGLGALAYHVQDPEVGHALYLAATLLTIGGPVWTFIIWHWLEEQR